MKIKKFLEKAAEEDRESLINDKDIEFLASIGVDYNKKRDAAKKEPDSSYYRTAKSVNNRGLFAGIACFLVVAITAVALSLYFSLKSPSVEPPVHYFDDNFVVVDSNLQELNADLQLFSLNINNSEYKVDIKRTYDSVSGDDLFFTLEFSVNQNPNKRFRLDIVVNKFYNHKSLTYTERLKEEQFSENNPEYTIKYSEESKTVPGTPFINIEILGELQIGEQWIYVVSYIEMAIGQSTFLDTLQSLISFK